VTPSPSLSPLPAPLVQETPHRFAEDRRVAKEIEKRLDQIKEEEDRMKAPFGSS
jgi:hypothetical protein